MVTSVGGPGNHVVTVDIPWNVIPDRTSVVNVGGGSAYINCYKNDLQGKPDFATRLTASCALEPFAGNQLDWIGDTNTFSRVRTGISAFSGGETPINQPCLWHIYANNKIHDSVDGIILNGTTGTNATPYASAAVIFRKNDVSGLTGVVYRKKDRGYSVMDVCENNTCKNVFQGIVMQRGSGTGQYQATVLRNNSFARGTATLFGSIGAQWDSHSTWTPTSGGRNRFSGFETGNASPNR
jgi:hypothetical protein